MLIKPLCAVDSSIALNAEERLRLEKVFQIETVSFSQLPLEGLERFDLALVHSKLSPACLKGLKRCKYIGVRAHNTDYVNADLAKAQGILVRGIPQVGATAVAEHTFALIFAITKQLFSYHNNVVEGRWREGLVPNFELSGKRLGVIGYGKIGKLVAEMGRVFGMEVLIHTRSGAAVENHCSLSQLLRESDIVTLHASIKSSDGPLLNESGISEIKKGAILINTSRGNLIDYTSLEKALISGNLYGAGLDVFPEEPITTTGLTQLPNVIGTPHLAFYTDQTLKQMNNYLISSAIEHYETEYRGNIE
ncbi:2-hydroxyacid dehydrogenase [Paenibacillus sp. GCM10027627]|uniref:2-hydroxyacid dehydrogenase n=1 Tax=unclassified Paenibacillus TaxID=185978 RepID=UPI0036443DCC